MQNILNIKYKLETQAKTAFSVAAAALNKEEEKLEALRRRKREYEEKARELANGTLDFLEIRLNRTAIETMKEAIKNQILAVQVMTERKTHEILKDKAFDEFKKEVEKEESKAVDELVSFTHNHAKEG